MTLWGSFANIFKVPELKSRVVYTLMMLAIYRFGCQVPTPGVDTHALGRMFESQSGSVLGFLNLFTGGAFENFSVMALGIMPYISASIILQLLTPVIPTLERLAKEGEAGRRRITQYTRYATVVLCGIHAYGMTFWLRNIGPVVKHWNFSFQVSTVITLTAGTLFLMWMGEQITEKGIGNGMSLLIFSGIVARFPRDILNTGRLVQARTVTVLMLAMYLVVILVTIGGIVYLQQGYRRIPIQYAKRVVGRRMFAGQSSQIPLKIDYSGVIAVIFASTLLSIPATAARAIYREDGEGFVQLLAGFLNHHLSPGAAVYTTLYAIMIIFFCYFYTAVIFNPVDLAENLKKQGGFVPGIRPGQPTAEYIDRTLTRIIIWGAFAIAAIAVVPDWAARAARVPVHFGGTSLLIVVGVALDTMKQVESHLLMRHYEGFMRSGRLKGRSF